jgi:hypothetical protein
MIAGLTSLSKDMQSLLEEVDFFMLDELRDLIFARAIQLTKTPNGSLSNDDRTLTHVLIGDCITIGKVGFINGVNVWRVRLESEEGGAGVLLGVARDDDGQLCRWSSAKNLTLRWRLDCSTLRFACPSEVRGMDELKLGELRQNAIVLIKLDMDAHTLSYAVESGNGRGPWQLACSALPSVKLWPYFHLTRINTVVTCL